jgi:hypothetical protein
MTAPAPSTSRLRVLTLSDLRTACAQRASEDLVDGILPAVGLVLLVGLALGGKSELMAAIVAAMVDGGSVAGRKAQQGNVIYCALEHADPEWLKLFASAAAALGMTDLSNLTIVRPPFDIFNPDDMNDLARLADEKQARLLIIDSSRRAGDHDEDKSKETAAIGRALEQLGASTSRCVIASHHFNHAGSIRGSTDWKALADRILELRPRDGSHRELTITSRHGEPYKVALKINRENGDLFIEEDTTTPEGDAELEGIVLAVVAKAPALSGNKLVPLVREAAKKTGRPGADNGEVNKALHALEARKAIINKGSPKSARWEKR